MAQNSRENNDDDLPRRQRMRRLQSVGVNQSEHQRPSLSAQSKDDLDIDNRTAQTSISSVRASIVNPIGLPFNLHIASHELDVGGLDDAINARNRSRSHGSPKDDELPIIPDDTSNEQQTLKKTESSLRAKSNEPGL